MNRKKLSVLMGLLLLIFGLCVNFVLAEEDDDLEGAAEESSQEMGDDSQEMDDEMNKDGASVPPQDEGIPPRGQQGAVTITSNPPKATVYLGGEELGITPIENHPFKSGRHDLTIMLRGEELVSTRFNVWPNKNNVFGEKLVMPYGTLIVDTKSKLKVFLDEDFISNTEGGPLTINNVEAGPHVVKLVKGRKSKKQEIELSGEDTVYVRISGM